MTDALCAITLSAVGSGLVTRGRRSLRWYCVGDGPVTVLLEPGAGIPATTWFPVLAAIASRARVVLYDRAGFGCSDRMPQPDLDAALRDLRAVVNEVAGGRCVLTGHSWGGLLAQMFALAELSEAIARSTTSDTALRDLLIRADSQYADTEQQLRNSAAEVALIPASLDKLTSLRATGAPITVPTVVLTAMKGRPQQYGQPMLDIQEGLVVTMPRHEVVWDAGHYIHVDQPDRVTAVIDEVISTVPDESGDRGESTSAC